MDESNVENMICNINLKYKIEDSDLIITIRYGYDQFSSEIDSLYIPLHDLKKALNNLE